MFKPSSTLLIAVELIFVTTTGGCDVVVREILFVSCVVEVKIFFGFDVVVVTSGFISCVVVVTDSFGFDVVVVSSNFAFVTCTQDTASMQRCNGIFSQNFLLH